MVRIDPHRWGWPLLLVLAGCGAAQFTAPVPEEPTEAVLADHRTAPLQDPSAFDVLTGRPQRVDLTNAWDFLFLITEAGDPQLQPFTFVTGEITEAGLQKVGPSFDALLKAPKAGYTSDAPTSIVEGDVLAMVSRRDPIFGGLRCRHFGKLEILEIDQEARTVRFRHIVNPNCENTGLIAGKSGVR